MKEVGVPIRARTVTFRNRNQEEARSNEDDEEDLKLVPPEDRLRQVKVLC